MAYPAAPLFADQIGFIRAAELAQLWGYADAGTAFRESCRKLNITPVPGRPGWYDPRLIRRRLDEAQGLATVPLVATDRPMTDLEARRARRGQASAP